MRFRLFLLNALGKKIYCFCTFARFKQNFNLA